MKRIFSFFFLVAFIFSCDNDEETNKRTTGEDCVTAQSVRTGQPIENQYIIQFKESLAGARAANRVQYIEENYSVSRADIIDRIDFENTYLVARLTATQRASLMTDPEVGTIEPDRIISIQSCFRVVAPTRITWNTQQVGYGDGRGKTAWILDTGVDIDHPDLNVDKIRSRTFLASGSYQDKNGHGTHIAGVIGALNNEVGTLGIASGASIVALQVLDENGEGQLSKIIAALAYVRERAKAGDVVNISVGLEDVSSILDNEIRKLASRNIYFALSAGNDGRSADNLSPARANGKNIYTVSAIDSTNHFATFSNFGSVVDYAAPGVRILSTYKDKQYALMSGTSMATPHVAGLLLINSGVVRSNGTAIGDPDGIPDPIAHQ